MSRKQEEENTAVRGPLSVEAMDGGHFLARCLAAPTMEAASFAMDGFCCGLRLALGCAVEDSSGLVPLSNVPRGLRVRSGARLARRDAPHAAYAATRDHPRGSFCGVSCGSFPAPLSPSTHSASTFQRPTSTLSTLHAESCVVRRARCHCAVYVQELSGCRGVRCVGVWCVVSDSDWPAM